MSETATGLKEKTEDESPLNGAVREQILTRLREATELTDADLGGNLERVQSILEDVTDRARAGVSYAKRRLNQPTSGRPIMPSTAAPGAAIGTGSMLISKNPSPEGFFRHCGYATEKKWQCPSHG